MTLGKRIKAARERLVPKPTQGDIGTHFGITDKAVSGWERDEAIPELDKIADLAALLRVPCVWLLKGKGQPPDQEAAEVKLDDLTASERAVIIATIDALRKERAKVA